jgi:hypothetical protein
MAALRQKRSDSSVYLSEHKGVAAVHSDLRL